MSRRQSTRSAGPPAETEFVVVGGGTAGCVVAARLAAAGRSVVLLEAGGPYRRILDVPLLGLWAWLRHPAPYTWPYITTPQPRLDGRSIRYPAGRMLGGSSAINAMVFHRGCPESYDRWDLPGWSYRELLPYFRRLEEHELGETDRHGADGPLAVSASRFQTPVARAFLEACAEAGMPANPDLNGADCAGAGFYHRTQRRGRRASARDYLRRLDGAGSVRVVLRAPVSRLLVKAGRAVGAEYVYGGEVRQIRAAECIVSAGAIRSPQILQLSGIGPAAELRRLGVPVVADRPGVGRNLRDQLRVSLPFELDAPSPASLGPLLRGVAEYALRRRGLFTSVVVDAGAIVATELGGPPDARISFAWRARPSDGRPRVALEAALLDPHSQGALWVESADPAVAPTLDPRYLSEPADLRRLEAAVRLAREIACQPALRATGVGRETDDRPSEQVIRASAESAYHLVGSCRMGRAEDEFAVTDPKLRVWGVDQLRVVDASVLPGPVAGNGQAVVYALAERAADLILNGASEA